jgi:hypothetical protein
VRSAGPSYARRIHTAAAAHLCQTHVCFGPQTGSMVSSGTRGVDDIPCFAPHGGGERADGGVQRLLVARRWNGCAERRPLTPPEERWRAFTVH